jgi:hypothetical protein
LQDFLFAAALVGQTGHHQRNDQNKKQHGENSAAEVTMHRKKWNRFHKYILFTNLYEEVAPILRGFLGNGSQNFRHHDQAQKL